MENIMIQAIALRKAEKFDESRDLLKPLLENKLYQAQAHLQTAWSYDIQGKEEEAIDHYLNALKGNLNEIDKKDSLLGLSSTLRSLGRYEDALIYFEKAIKNYPDFNEIKPFYAMCLYNLGRNKEAVSLLLNLLLDTTDEASIISYKRAISLYAEDLDRKW